MRRIPNTIFRTYDSFRHVTAEWGATYPVRYTYDTAGRCTSLTTFRTTGGTPSSATDGDTTTWTHDPYTGNCLSKTYADGTIITYTYTPDNLPLRTTYASGKWKENVYDMQRRLCGVIYSSPDMDYELQLDEYGRTTFASNAVAQTAYALAMAGGATNEVRVTGNVIDRITRTFDGADRLTGLAMPERDYEQFLAYSTNGLPAAISNSDAVVTYDYSDDLRDVGYAIAFANGGTFVRTMVRDPFRRDLILAVTNSCGTHSQGIGYTYDALSRPDTRNGDTFCYNGRSEVIGAIIDGSSELHEYDEIGNSTLAAYNFITNIYTANNVNQYTSILSASESPREPTYDTDGNMTFDGVLAYSYDAENQLVSVLSNGSVLVTNQYDHKGRRVRKVTPVSETTFLYDDWNLVYEREIVGAITNETFYYWGKDISGTLQGAGGVGGLLYLKRNSTIYVPHTDAYGNIIRYTDTMGNIVASYTYGAFGNLLSATGPLANIFRHHFSSKYYDAETGLYYYGYRFYSPSLTRWLNRDPIGEVDCPNLYCSFVNSPVFITDPLGKTVFVITDSTPSRKASITEQRGNRTLSPRGITRITGSLNFSCDKKCVLHAKGVIQLWIELLNEDSPRWNERYPRYSSSTNTREDQNTLSHEMDHFSTWSAFLDFVETANSLDGKKFFDCQDRASRYNAAYQKYKAETSAHSLKFDKPGWNQGNQYSRHPLNTSMFKWE
jgi:RHS repeat-associated protein